MMLPLYTKAVVEKLKKIFDNTHYSIYEQLLEKAANSDLTKNLPTLPVVGVYRVGWELDTQNDSYEQAFQGTAHLRNVANAEGQFLKLKRRPIIINFQFDVVSDSQEEMDNLAEGLLWEISNFPRVSFQITSPFVFAFQESNLMLQGVSDSSDVSQFKEVGRIYRTTYDYALQGAYLVDWVDWEEVRKIEVNFTF